MFFVGLAGSFMPYLLCLGVFFALTLGAKVNHNPEPIALAEKIIEFQDTNNQNVNSFESYYFLNQQENKDVQQLTIYSALFKIDEIITYPPRGKTMGYNVILNYSFQACRNYFGLSPPSLIS